MEEKYFIIDIKNRECGAFTEAELNDIGLYEDSLIFCADWSKRKPLNQIPELSHIKRKPESIKPYNSDYGKNLILITQPITKTKENEELVNPYSFKRKKVRIVVVSWLFFHVMALILSNIQIRFFNKNSVWHKSLEQLNHFWPFVDFYSKHYGIDDWNFYFNGIFYYYDISEFLLYNLIFGFVWFILYTFKQKS